MLWKHKIYKAKYLQEVCRINRKYGWGSVFPNQVAECSKEARELMGIAESDQYYS